MGIYIYSYLPAQFVRLSERPTHLESRTKAQVIFNSAFHGNSKFIIPSIVMIDLAGLLSRMTNNSSVVGEIMNEVNGLVANHRAEGFPIDSQLEARARELAQEHGLRYFEAIIAASYFDHPATVITSNQYTFDSLNNLRIESRDRIEVLHFKNTTEDQLRTFLNESRQGGGIVST